MSLKGTFNRVASFALILVAASFAQAQEKVIRISASSTAVDNIFSKIQKPFEAETGIKLTFLDAKGAHNYFKNVIDGKVDAAVAPFSYSDWVKQMAENDISVPSDTTHRIIGRDKMNVVTHKSAGVTKLTFDQIEGLFTGNFKSFKEVGGADVPVVVITFADSKGKNATFKRLVMKDKAYAKNKAVKGEDEDVVKAVAETPGAIGFRSSAAPASGVQQIETTDPIGRPITLVNRGQPSENLQKLINFIRANGSKYGVD